MDEWREWDWRERDATPPTEYVRQRHLPMDINQFDRWLAARDRVVAANAWDEGDARLTEWHESKKGHWDNESRPGYRIWVEHPKPTNPYRITEENN